MTATSPDPLPHDTTAADRERFAFLNHLDAAWFDVTDWEASFIENLITAPRPLTPAQRRAIDDLRTKYPARL